jgi:hypothetical protein
MTVPPFEGLRGNRPSCGRDGQERGKTFAGITLGGRVVSGRLLRVDGKCCQCPITLGWGGMSGDAGLDSAHGVIRLGEVDLGHHRAHTHIVTGTEDVRFLHGKAGTPDVT